MHAVSGYNGASYAYDANGCLISTSARGGQSLWYDPASRPTRVDAGGATLCGFAYDGDGLRRKRLDSLGTIHYLGPYERNVGNGLTTTEVVTKYYTATFGKLTRLIAVRRAGPAASGALPITRSRRFSRASPPPPRRLARVP